MSGLERGRRKSTERQLADVLLYRTPGSEGEVPGNRHLYPTSRPWIGASVSRQSHSGSWALRNRRAKLADGSHLTTVYPSDKDRRHRTGGIRVRVVEYRLEGVAGAEPLYRLMTTILDPAQAPAAELAALYHERWEIEGALAELKTQLRGAQ